MVIHPRTDIDPTARIADDVNIGPGVVIGANSVIESGVELGANVVIGQYTTIGENVRVWVGAVIGAEPQDLKFDGSPTTCTIGPRTIIREYCTINRGTQATGATRVGSDCMLMAYSHVGHDCKVGNHVITANNVIMGGHCEVHDHVVIGGHVAMHQFVRIGKMAMIGGLSGIKQDAPPFMITSGFPPARVYGVNYIGLRRNGFTPETRALIKQAFRVLYRSNFNFTDALTKIRNEFEQTEEIRYLLEFFKGSRRGMSRGHKVGIIPDDDVYSEEMIRDIKIV